ncbi:MAG: PCYCGC motif-containing (lipo)protein [Fidelibacterota bacterium]
MKKRTVLISAPVVAAAFALVIGIAYFAGSRSGENRAMENSHERKSVDHDSGMMKAASSEMAAVLKCPCGCDKNLLDCQCPTAMEVSEQLNSLAAMDLSDEMIKDKMIRKYGRSIVANVKSAAESSRSVSVTSLPTTLNPELVAEVARKPYEIAREFPNLLAVMPCFCGCEVERVSRKAHDNLLDCYTNRHAENCLLCMNEATFAKQRMDEGSTPGEIRDLIVQKWGQGRS